MTAPLLLTEVSLAVSIHPPFMNTIRICEWFCLRRVFLQFLQFLTSEFCPKVLPQNYTPPLRFTLTGAWWSIHIIQFSLFKWAGLIIEDNFYVFNFCWHFQILSSTRVLQNLLSWLMLLLLIFMFACLFKMPNNNNVFICCKGPLSMYCPPIPEGFEGT